VTCNTIWVELSKDLKKFWIFNDGERTVVVGNPEGNINTMTLLYLEPEA
jgi:hypothetical protein